MSFHSAEKFGDFYNNQTLIHVVFPQSPLKSWPRKCSPPLPPRMPKKALFGLGSTNPTGNGRCQMFSAGKVRRTNFTSIPFLIWRYSAVECSSFLVSKTLISSSHIVWKCSIVHSYLYKLHPVSGVSLGIEMKLTAPSSPEGASVKLSKVSMNGKVSMLFAAHASTTALLSMRRNIQQMFGSTVKVPHVPAPDVGLA